MSDHIPDAGDPDATPIMDAVDVKCDELNVMDAICYAVYEGQKLEIQLNEANARIQRLEEALDLVRPHCDSVHHSKKHQHQYGQPCPVVALIENVKEAKL